MFCKYIVILNVYWKLYKDTLFRIDVSRTCVKCNKHKWGFWKNEEDSWVQYVIGSTYILACFNEKIFLFFKKKK